ncbi:MAG TPA: glycosyltransferase [Roseococcus sp.]|nr:glycosyltransferase [Roseococcus sp.]
MIHFFPRFPGADESPTGEALRNIGIRYRIFELLAPQNHRFRFQILLVGYPKLAWAALRVAMQSLLGPRPQRPRLVVLGSDIEVLVFALVRAWPGAAKPDFVFLPFIFTQRASPALNRLRLAYYRFVMRRTACAICHSTLELERYRALFAGCGTAFVFVPWGGYVPPAERIEALAPPRRIRGEEAQVVAAGRSGRDYPTLVAAAAGLPCRIAIICNEQAALDGVAASEQVALLTDCFGMGYLSELLHADIVVVPLRVEDISAGQMVLIQTMALGRPLIVTRTPTIGDYLEDGVNALLVPRGDVEAMRDALRRLLDDPAAAAALGARARRDYEARFTQEAHLRELLRVIQEHGEAGRLA